MGVHGLWRLIEPSGKPVPLETLENKVLAVDISIWLHQAVKGFQDSKGAPLPNAHLLGIYHRVCKLLYFKIKPVFVFDGGVPVLKKQTIAKRNQLKSRNSSEADRLQKQLLDTLLKHTAISNVLSEKTKASLTAHAKKSYKHDNLYELPATEIDSTLSSDEGETESTSDTPDSSPTKNWDLHTIDMNSVHFKSLPVDVRHEILTDLKETRKQNSWGRLHELPKQSDDFSSYQMKRLLKRQSVQAALDEAAKEMGGASLSLAELESILKDQGIQTTTDTIGKRIASDENTRLEEESEQKKEENESAGKTETSKTKADVEEEEELQKAIAMSLQEVASTSSTCTSKMEFSFLENFNDEDFQSESDEEVEETREVLSSAQNYMMEYSGLTPNEISKIITGAGKKSKLAVEKEKIIKIPNRLTIIPEQLETLNKENDETPISECDVKIGENMNKEKHLGSSCSNDFVEVIDEKEKINPLEIVIDPSENPEDDLFGDIFMKEDDEDKGLKITIQPNLKPEDDLFSDVFKENAKVPPSQLEPQQKETLKPCLESTEIAKQAEVEINKAEEVKVNEGIKVDENKKDIAQKPVTPQLTLKEMSDLKDTLQREKTDLIIEKANKERLASNITDQMYQEAQELLELFGVPYLIAPMEAEAQCAFLDGIELTDGTITDDSDIWLFGGRTVYKNFFNQSKYVMEFKAENIKHHFKLSREQMILLALLVGSDYTTGIQGVGPVTALEILAAFPPSNSSEFSLSQAQLISGLKEFRSWFSKGKSSGPGRATLKNKLKNITFTDNFPSLQVIQAYLDPKVETSEERFSWGKPDVVSLTLFAREKFGWGSKKTDEILNPVIKRMEENRSQKSIREFFKTKFKVDSGEAEGKMSKRVKTAIGRFGKTQEELIAEEMEELEKEQRKTFRSKSEKPRVRKERNKQSEGEEKPEDLENKTTGTVKKKSRQNASKEGKIIRKVDEDNVEEKKKETADTTKGSLPKRGRRPKSKNQSEIVGNDNNSAPCISGVTGTGIKNNGEAMKDANSLEPVDESKEFEDLAAELRMRRKKKSELLKTKQMDPPKKKIKIPPQKQVEDILKELEVDEDIQLLAATASRSSTRVQEIEKEVKKDLDRSFNERKHPSLHTKEIIHQRLRDKTDVMKNKLKAIEVYRKSKKGPGYVKKRAKTVSIPKEDAGLSEDSE
ncbi:hypothetical protein JTB14_015510 [Gonioctena quinquepunctata]|nr:hypothetical protein JTB14_015510 [Gonioctena quinquepunctata]